MLFPPVILDSNNGIEAAGGFAGAAFDAFVGINDMHFLDFSVNRVYWTFTGASRAAFAERRIYFRAGQGLAFAGWTDLPVNMRFIFFTEITQR
jgi:hypothetical protein